MSFEITQTPTEADLFLYPSANDVVALTPNGAAQNYLCVDDVEQEADDDDTYVSTSSTTDVTDIYRTTGHTDEAGVINYVLIIVRAKSYLYVSGPTSTFKILYATGTTTNLSANAYLNTGYQDLECLLISPPGGGSWTWELINALRIGVTAHSQSKTIFPVYIMRPNADSASSGATPSSGSDLFAMVDEETPDDDTTYISLPDHDDYYRLNTPDPSNNGETIDNVVLYTRAKRLGTKGSCYPYLYYNDGSWRTFNGANFFLSTSYVTQADTFTQTAAHAAWTWPVINTMRLGVNNEKLTGIRVTQQYLVVNTHTTFTPEIRVTSIYAKVNYVPAPVHLRLNSPRTLDYDNDRAVETTTMDDGTKFNDDYGSAGKILRFTGVEPSGSASLMHTLDRLRTAHAEVDVTGLPSRKFNGTWRIQSFDYVDEGETDLPVYSYNLGLISI